ncbi:hypothetical protein [Mesorhizobium sp. M0701]|uniref:hypothetical protein n=1 Tax=Mesorhizobium sp. M0701 TaxID=2956989 RepID=UPI00333A50E3
MIQLIAPACHGDFADEPHAMHQNPLFPITTKVRSREQRKCARARAAQNKNQWSYVDFETFHCHPLAGRN